MKTENLFGKESHAARFFVLCDVHEKDEEKKAELETLVHDAISEELEKSKLDQDAIEKAVKSANNRLLVACGKEPTNASALVIADVTHANKPYPEYLVGGVGNVRVLGVGQDKVHVAFSVPEKKSQPLGAEKIDVHFTRISGKTYPTLIALDQKAYAEKSDAQWNKLVGSPNLPEKARELIGSGNAWVLIPGAVAATKKKRSKTGASLGLVLVMFLAVAGTGLWLKERRKLSHKQHTVQLEQSAEVLANALEAKELEIAELEDTLQEMNEEMEIAVEETAPLFLDEELTLIGSRFEEELNAHQALLDEYKEEVTSLKDALDGQTHIKESYDRLAEMLAEESERQEQLEAMLGDREDRIVSLESELAELKENQAKVTEEYATLKEVASESHETIAAYESAQASLQARLEELTSTNDEASRELAVLRAALADQEQTGFRMEELFGQNEQLERQRAMMSQQIADLEGYRVAYEAEHALRMERDETLASLAVNIEGWRKAVTSMERSREELAQELAQLRASRGSGKQPAPAGQVKRVHLVSPGETLEAIAHRYYSDFGQVEKIVEANREVLGGQHSVEVGTALVIP